MARVGSLRSARAIRAIGESTATSPPVMQFTPTSPRFVPSPVPVGHTRRVDATRITILAIAMSRRVTVYSRTSLPSVPSPVCVGRSTTAAALSTISENGATSPLVRGSSRMIRMLRTAPRMVHVRLSMRASVLRTTTEICATSPAATEPYPIQPSAAGRARVGRRSIVYVTRTTLEIAATSPHAVGCTLMNRRFVVGVVTAQI